MSVAWANGTFSTCHIVRRGGHPLLDKIYTNSVSYLTDPTAVCSRIRSHSGELSICVLLIDRLIIDKVTGCGLSCYLNRTKLIIVFC